MVGIDTGGKIPPEIMRQATEKTAQLAPLEGGHVRVCWGCLWVRGMRTCWDCLPASGGAVNIITVYMVQDVLMNVVEPIVACTRRFTRF